MLNLNFKISSILIYEGKRSFWS